MTVQAPRRTRTFLFLSLLFFLACGTFASAKAVLAQDEPGSQSQETSQETSQVTQEKIAALETKLSEAEGLEEDQKKEIAEVIEQASAELARGQKLEAAARTEREQAQSVQSRLEQLQVASKAELQPMDLPASASLPQLEAKLADRLAALQQSKAKLADLQSDATKRGERRTQIAQLQASRGSRIAEAEKQLAAEAPAGESTLMTTARKFLQLAKLQSLAYEAPALQWEVSRYDAEQAVDLTTLQVQVAEREVRQIESDINSLEQRITAARQQQARSKLQQLTDSAKSVDDPRLKQLAQRNAELAKKNDELVQNVVQAVDETNAAQAALDTLVANDERTRQRVERVGLSGATGLELRNQISKLPDFRSIKRRSLVRQEKMQELESNRLNYEDELYLLERNELPESASDEERSIRNDTLEILQSLIRNHEKYFQELSEADFSENQLLSKAESFEAFLNEHVLWIRSGKILASDSLSQSAQSLRLLAKPSVWMGAAAAIAGDAKEQPWLYLLAIIALFLMLPTRYRGRVQLAELGAVAQRPICTDFSVTLRAMLLTLAIAAVWPVLLMFVGWRMTASTASTLYTVAIGHALISSAFLLLLVDTIRQTGREGGLWISHFGWSPRAAQLLRRQGRQLRLLGLPLTFAIVLLHDLTTVGEDDALMRLCLAIGLLWLAWVLYRVLHPRHGVSIEFLQAYPDSWVTKTASFWFGLVISLPIAMALLAIVGYSYGAQQLAWRFWHSIWIAVSLVIIRALAIRALQISHRKQRIAAAKEKLARERLAKESESDSEQASLDQTSAERPISAASEVVVVENEAEAFRTSTEQVMRIVHSGLWFAGLLSLWLLWADILPAFSIFDQVTLWDVTQDVSVQTTNEDGGIEFRTETAVVPITPVNVLLAVLIALVTFTLVRNVPGLIEIVVLQRLPIDTSVKFAIATMCRYVILVVGLLLTFSTVGVDWSKLQWLVAALTVGLGFGLQEIFGNFVSGLIILWERPVRIGDVVTLDGVSGTVSRIQMRATTISDWDRKEYIVPNKDFVTGRLLNWTRSDQISRVVIEVGVAYGSNVQQAIDMLIQVAKDHPLILDDPAPSATFDKFGDSTLNLTLRCFLPSLDGRLDAISQLHLEINNRFNAAGIEIAFPQQDIHIRSMPAEAD